MYANAWTINKPHSLKNKPRRYAKSPTDSVFRFDIESHFQDNFHPLDYLQYRKFLSCPKTQICGCRKPVLMGGFYHMDKKLTSPKTLRGVNWLLSTEQLNPWQCCQYPDYLAGWGHYQMFCLHVVECWPFGCLGNRQKSIPQSRFARP